MLLLQPWIRQNFLHCKLNYGYGSRYRIAGNFHWYKIFVEYLQWSGAIMFTKTCFEISGLAHFFVVFIFTAANRSLKICTQRNFPLHSSKYSWAKRKFMFHFCYTVVLRYEMSHSVFTDSSVRTWEWLLIQQLLASNVYFHSCQSILKNHKNLHPAKFSAIR